VAGRALGVWEKERILGAVVALAVVRAPGRTPLTTQIEVKRETTKVLTFLRGRADPRGVVKEDQKALAEVYGSSQTLFHRRVHRLIDEKKLRVLGKGAQGKLTLLIL
jgi:hypothetical protein